MNELLSVNGSSVGVAVWAWQCGRGLLLVRKGVLSLLWNMCGSLTCSEMERTL